jgi:hypothetical protein
VRAYARDPSEQNAARVRLAWQRVRQSESLAVWNKMKARWLGRDALFPYAKSINGLAWDEPDSENEQRRTGT